jgi:hypothetical protein
MRVIVYDEDGDLAFDYRTQRRDAFALYPGRSVSARSARYAAAMAHR